LSRRQAPYKGVQATGCAKWGQATGPRATPGCSLQHLCSKPIARNSTLHTCCRFPDSWTGVEATAEWQEGRPAGCTRRSRGWTHLAKPSWLGALWGAAPEPRGAARPLETFRVDSPPRVQPAAQNTSSKLTTRSSVAKKTTSRGSHPGALTAYVGDCGWLEPQLWARQQRGRPARGAAQTLHGGPAAGGWAASGGHTVGKLDDQLPLRAAPHLPPV